MCQRLWTQYKDCNHEHTPMARIIRCHTIDDGVPETVCRFYNVKRRTIRCPGMCNDCAALGVVADEGFKGGRWDSR
jgi:hypothetical protein